MNEYNIRVDMVESGGEKGGDGGLGSAKLAGGVLSYIGTITLGSKTLPNGLTLEERQLIERDILAKRPIGVGESENAYNKFLNSIFPHQNISFPYYATIRDAITITTKLTELFNRKVKNASTYEVSESIRLNNHYTGFYFLDKKTGLKVLDIPGKIGTAWNDEGTLPTLGENLCNNEIIWYTRVYRYNDYSDMVNPQVSENQMHSVIPVFAE